MTLVLSKGDSGEGVLEELREFIGPTDSYQAKEEAPERYCCSTKKLFFRNPHQLFSASVIFHVLRVST